jgi:hypothetical protein
LWSWLGTSSSGREKEEGIAPAALKGRTEHVFTLIPSLFTLLCCYAASCVMQPLIGHTFTHCGLSYSPSHSVHSLALMMYNPFFTLMEAVGHSGSQSPQEVHKSILIFIAMMILLLM